MQRPFLRILKTIAIAFVLLWAGSEVAHAQWTQVNGVPAGANPSTCLLLTDGTVMCQANEGGNGWLRLTPDNTGNYENGKWTSLDNAPEGTDSTDVTEATPATCAPCLYSPTYYASAVLPDGRVVVIGGEYNVNSTGSNGALTDIGFLFDPTKPSGSQWSAQLTNPFGYGLFGPDTLGCTGDSESVITQTGTMLIANVCGFSNAQIASFDPSTLTFTAINPTGKNGPNESNDEEGWTILPGGNVFTVDANSPENSEIYDPTTNAWGQDVNTAGIELTDLSVNCDSHELGPAVALANGTIIQFSGNPSGQNALYTIATNSWASSPGFNFPSPTGVPDTVADGPASWLVNGDALVIASPGCIPTGGGKYSTFNAPIHVYEFNGATLSDVTPSSPGSNGPVNNNASFVYRMLLLPSGRVLVTHRGDGGSPGDVWTYTPSGPVVSPGEPVITTFPSVIGQGQTYSISGQMFNGFTQGASYGDDAQDATNWPLVRITNTGSGHVAYVRTHDHSRMGVEAVGDPEIVSTNFDLPADFELGASTLVVVTNGLASDPVDVTVEESTSLAFTAASATSSDYSDPATVQAVLTSGGTPVSGESITFVLGSGAGTETCSGTTNGAGLATCSITPNQAAGGYTLTATFAGDATYTGSTISTPFTILHEETAIAFTGASATNSDYHDAATVQVLLTTDSGTTVIGSEMVTITLGSGAGTETCSGTTNSSGIAFCSITPNQQAGVYTITVAFAGDAFYAASMNSAPFTINLEETTTKFTASSPTVIANGQPATFSATLLEDGTIAPVPFGQTVTVTLGTGITAQTCNGTTNATGLATCTIASVNQPLGPNTVGAKFAGDPYYQPSSASEPVILFAFLPHGSMIIGNLDAATGTHVEFWGATWSTVNALSGGPAPNSFKGFADNSLQSCGGNWSTSPGNSSGPPATLPSYMGVIASGAAAQSGSTISGTGPIIVVVQTNLGYAANPGHPGTGTVVATYCHP
jgi:hypothetical protein